MPLGTGAAATDIEKNIITKNYHVLRVLWYHNDTIVQFCFFNSVLIVPLRFYFLFVNYISPIFIQ